MSSVKIESYNKKLLEENKHIDIISYIKYVAKNIYVINISFMDDLLELIIKDEINIHHKQLVEFGILKLKGGTSELKIIIEQNTFIENEDFKLVRNVPDQLISGTKYKNEYYFHPDAFGIILMRSKNKKEYAKYYNLCQKCIKHYSNYQLELKQSEVSRLINKLEISNNEQKETNKKLDISNSELRESNKKLDKTNNIFIIYYLLFIIYYLLFIIYYYLFIIKKRYNCMFPGFLLLLIIKKRYNYMFR